MTDIKTREVTRGSIKTIDRAAASMHHLKVDTIRNRNNDYGNSQESDNAGAYAENHIKRTAGDSAAFASRAGMDMLLNSREWSEMRIRYKEHFASRESKTSLTDITGQGWLMRKSFETLPR